MADLRVKVTGSPVGGSGLVEAKPRWIRMPASCLQGRDPVYAERKGVAVHESE